MTNARTEAKQTVKNRADDDTVPKLETPNEQQIKINRTYQKRPCHSLGKVFFLI